MEQFTPHTKVVIGNVPWDNSYLNVVDYPTASHQNEAILSHMRGRSHIEFEDVNIVRTTFDLIVPNNFERYRNYGYVAFTNPDLLQGVWLYAFITDVEFVSVNSTRIKLELDLWQNHHLTLNLKPSFVNRMHIPKNQDTVGKWLAPEPFTLKQGVQKYLNGFVADDFKPIYVLNSLYNPSSVDVSPYGGPSTINEFASFIYGWICESTSQLKNLLTAFEPQSGSTVDHRQDIIGVTALPSWVVESIISSGDTPSASGPFYIEKNGLHYKSQELSLTNTLACGYTPKNNKMLTSIAKKYLLHNLNGFQKTFKPELFVTDTPICNVMMKALCSSSMVCQVNGYGVNADDLPVSTEANFLIPYTSNFMTAYNQNVGSVRAINSINATAKTVGGIAGLAGAAVSAFTGNIPFAALALAPGISSLAQGGKDLANATEDYTGVIGGSSSDMLQLIAGWVRPRWAHISPTYDECKQADDYLSAYGYAINEVLQPSINNRSNWNFCQIEKPALSVNAPANVRTKFAEWFERGITVWHNINNMNNYSLDNN